MFANLSDIIKMGAAAAAGAMLCTLYYEGLPVVSHIPYINIIPIIGDIAVGEKQRYASEQIKVATEQMVTKFELDALAAQMAQETRLRAAAEQANTEASKRAVASQQAKETADAELARLRVEASQNKKLSTPTEDDLLWLQQH